MRVMDFSADIFDCTLTDKFVLCVAVQVLIFKSKF